MANSKYFGIPFGASGDRAIIPDGTDPSGAVSYQQGFGPDYERDPATDPLAKRVPRAETNEYLYQATNAIKFLQLLGSPEFFADDGSGVPVSYPIGARVYHDAGTGPRVWRSLVAANTAVPGSDMTKWTPYEKGTFLGVRTFTTSGTYVPSPGTSQVLAVVVGAGGGSGGLPATTAGTYALSPGANGGAMAVGLFPASAFGAGVAVTVGTGGAAGPSGGGGGGNGGDTSLGALATAGGGSGTFPAGPTNQSVLVHAGPTTPATATGGNIFTANGAVGSFSIGGGAVSTAGAASAAGGNGGTSPLGGAGPGAGGGGAAISNGTGATQGNAGRNGLVILYEYA